MTEESVTMKHHFRVSIITESAAKHVHMLHAQSNLFHQVENVEGTLYLLPLRIQIGGFFIVLFLYRSLQMNICSMKAYVSVHVPQF